MGLGAGRTELDISLTGEDETRRMIEDAKKRMAELEAKLRGLTDASRDNEDAADDQRGALERLNGALGGIGEGLEGPVEGLDKLFGGIDKVMGVFGSLSEIVQGAIEVYKFFTEESEESKKATEELNKKLAEQAEQAKATAEAIGELKAAERATVTENRGIQIELLQEQLKTAELLEQKQKARQIAGQIEYETELSRVAAIGEKHRDVEEQRKKVQGEMLVSAGNALQFEKQIQGMKDLQKESENEIKRIKEEQNKVSGVGTRIIADGASEIAEHEAKIKALKTSILSLTNNLLAPEKARTDQAAKTLAELKKQEFSLRNLWDLAKNTAEALGAAITRKLEKPEPTGGGGGKSKAELKKEEELRDLERQMEARARINAADERDDLVRESVRKEAKLFEDLARKRYDVQATLDSIQTDLTDDETTNKRLEEINKPFADALKKQLAEINKVLDTRVEFDYEIAGPEEEDAFIKALGTQKTAYDKLTESIGANIAMQSKAQDASVELLEAYERGLPTKRLEEFQTGLAQLQQMSVPAFGEIGNVIGQVSDQFAKYKAGQTSMTNATIQGASAIAGAIAKQVGGVKAEAGIRALFETAMGFATLANPVESAGHFTAAAMFGLAAGGVLKTGASSGAGGQKAPATRTASTTASSNTGGGGPITNVYNLQTGIVDGQSTARAFRQAEQQARNTGMASAGGW
jgi:hypothetical protein